MSGCAGGADHANGAEPAGRRRRRRCRLPAWQITLADLVGRGKLAAWLIHGIAGEHWWWTPGIMGSSARNGDHMSTHETKEHWEQHYGERDRIWSGRVNVQFADVAGDLTPGRALDLGCGEGADAVWLAERGWNVTAIDISDTALGRAREGAAARGVADRIEFRQVDLSEGFPNGTFDLISAQFLHSKIPLDRQKILIDAAAALLPGGL